MSGFPCQAKEFAFIVKDKGESLKALSQEHSRVTCAR